MKNLYLKNKNSNTNPKVIWKFRNKNINNLINNLKKLLQSIQLNQNQRKKNSADNAESFTLTELQNSESKSNNSATGPNEIHYTLYYTLLKELSLSAGTVEYADCTSAEG